MPAYIAIVGLYVAATLLTLGVVAQSKPQPVDAAADGALVRSPLRQLTKTFGKFSQPNSS